MNDYHSNYPFSDADAIELAGFYRIRFLLPNGQLVSLDGNHPESLATAANEMYKKEKKLKRQIK